MKQIGESKIELILTGTFVFGFSSRQMDDFTFYLNSVSFFSTVCFNYVSAINSRYPKHLKRFLPDCKQILKGRWMGINCS